MTSKKVSFQEIENSDEEQGLTQFEIVDSLEIKQKKKCSCARSLRVRLLVIILILITGGVVYYFSQNYEYDGISARIMGHGHHHRKTCEDFEFGCCEIYNKCIDKTSYLESRKIELSVYRILARDTLKTNCPTLESLIDDYNKHYHSKVHDCGEFGCCDEPIEVGCDHAIRKTFTDGNNNETVEYFNSHNKFVQIMKLKKDQEGSNCDQWHTPMYDVVSAYNHHYPNPRDQLLLLCILCIIFSVCWLCDVTR